MPPDRGQRTHWYAKLVGEFVHEPLVAVSVAPTAAGAGDPRLGGVRRPLLDHGRAAARKREDGRERRERCRGERPDERCPSCRAHRSGSFRRVDDPTSSPDLGKQTHLLRKLHPPYESFTLRLTRTRSTRVARYPRSMTQISPSQAAAPARRGASRGTPASRSSPSVRRRGVRRDAPRTCRPSSSSSAPRPATSSACGFATTVAGPCMRCLAPASVAVEVDAREYQATDPGARRRAALRVRRRRGARRRLVGARPGRAEPPRPDPLPSRLRRALPRVREGPERRAARPRGRGDRPALGGARGPPRRRGRVANAERCSLAARFGARP